MLPSVGLGDRPADRQAESVSPGAPAAGRIHPVEPVEDAGQMLRGDADSRIGRRRGEPDSCGTRPGPRSSRPAGVNLIALSSRLKRSRRSCSGLPMTWHGERGLDGRALAASRRPRPAGDRRSRWRADRGGPPRLAWRSKPASSRKRRSRSSLSRERCSISSSMSSRHVAILLRIAGNAERNLGLVSEDRQRACAARGRRRR